MKTREGNERKRRARGACHQEAELIQCKAQAALARARERSRELSQRPARPQCAHAGRVEEFKPGVEACYGLVRLRNHGALPLDDATAVSRELFRLRTLMETKMVEDLEQGDIFALMRYGKLFGSSEKQGCSLRFPLISCNPTAHCLSGCYGHEGHDGHWNSVYRGAVNYYIGMAFDACPHRVREVIMEELGVEIDKGVALAEEEQEKARVNGFLRQIRIRFGHVGDLGELPSFANALALEIKKRNSRVVCVIYTRHQHAMRLDPDLFVINFSVDGPADPRLRYKPERARLVSTAWGGIVNPDAAVNFLEHHDGKVVRPIGGGFICPVTRSHEEVPSCDEARCDRCFRPVGR